MKKLIILLLLLFSCSKEESFQFVNTNWSATNNEYSYTLSVTSQTQLEIIGLVNGLKYAKTTYTYQHSYPYIYMTSANEQLVGFIQENNMKVTIANTDIIVYNFYKN